MNKGKAKLTVIVAFALLAILFPRFGVSSYIIHVVTLSLIWVIMTEGLNIIQGLTGYVSMAQASFFGIGAYGSALFMTKLHWPFWGSLPIVLCITAIAGLAIGYPSLRTKGHYFAIITLGFCMVLNVFMITEKELTGSVMGIMNIPIPEGFFGIDFIDKTSFYYLILFFAVFTIIFCWRLKNSKIGRALMTIRENESLAQAVGISLIKYKVLAFVLSAVFGGLAGAFFASYMRVITPPSFGGGYSLNAILAIVMGGNGTISGPIIGSFMLNFLPEALRVTESMRMVVYGALLIIIVIFLPSGIMGILNKLAKYITARINRYKKSEQNE
jgi:branched-chain amino acid transport system permease protein